MLHAGKFLQQIDSKNDLLEYEMWDVYNIVMQDKDEYLKRVNTSFNIKELTRITAT